VSRKALAAGPVSRKALAAGLTFFSLQIPAGNSLFDHKQNHWCRLSNFQNRKKHMKHRRFHTVRGGQASIEVVAATAVMVPFAGFVLFTGLKICKQVYMVAANGLCWPFM
jgi:hypothetical protein